MSFAVRIVLFVCAVGGFSGAGAAAAVRQYRLTQYVDDDQGFTAVAVMLCLAAALCAAMAGGLPAIAALFLPFASASYAYTAQRLGIFRIDTGEPAPFVTAESELHT